MKINKKLMIPLIIAGAVIILGGVAYFFYNKASADAYTESYCSGLTGRTYSNCNANAMQLKKFMMGHSNSQFKKMIDYMDKQSK